MYTYAIGDDIMIEKPDGFCVGRGTIEHIESDEHRMVNIYRDYLGRRFSIKAPYKYCYPILSMTGVEQWQIQKHTIRAINRILKQQPPDQQ